MNKRAKGFVLVTTLLIVVVLMVLIEPYVMRVATEYRLMSKMRDSYVALNVAEAGIEHAIWEIRYNGRDFDGNYDVDGTGNQTWTLQNVAFSDPCGVIGAYDVTVLLPINTTVNIITATSHVPNIASQKETKTVRATYNASQFAFTHAIASTYNSADGNPSINMQGSVSTDSYDSSLGPYNPETAGHEGSIISNGKISLGGNVYVDGNANPGPGFDFPDTPPPPVNGTYDTLAAPFEVAPIEDELIQSVQAVNDNEDITIVKGANPAEPYTGGTDLDLEAGATLILPSGTYYFSSIKTGSNSQIIVSGPSVIYVTGNIAIAGAGIINSTGLPRDLSIRSTGSDIKLTGTSDYCGTIYAPNATVKVSGTLNLYGAIVSGKSVDTGTAVIHYDINLLNTVSGPANGMMLSWIEQ